MGIERITEGTLLKHAQEIATDYGSVCFAPFVMDSLRQFCARIGIEVEPDPPKPKVRAFTPVEAAAHFGRAFCYRGDTRRISTLGDSYLLDQFGAYWGYDVLAEEGTWADDNSPCGIVTT